MKRSLAGSGGTCFFISGMQGGLNGAIGLDVDKRISFWNRFDGEVV